MVYSSASSMNAPHAMAGTNGVQKPKHRRKYVPHHMRSEESALKRNARERRRQNRINDALDRLNLHLPRIGSGNGKTGKEGIIRRAIDHIQTLSSILGQTSRKLPLFPAHGNPVEIPEPSPEFQPLPAELFGQLMIEAQHWISSTQASPLMTSSPNNTRIPATDRLDGEYIISDLPYTTQAVNVPCQSSCEESGYFDCSYTEIYSPSSSSGFSAADDIVDELFSSDSFASDMSNEHLESIIDIHTFVWYISIYQHQHHCICFPSPIHVSRYHQRWNVICLILVKQLMLFINKISISKHSLFEFVFDSKQDRDDITKVFPFRRCNMIRYGCYGMEPLLKNEPDRVLTEMKML